MRLTHQANYCVRVLIYCAANRTRPSKVPEIARIYGISETHLFKIMRVLVENGFVQTFRGRHGGIRLAKPAEEITLGDVVRAAEENFHLAECFDETRQDCPLVTSCNFNRALSEALAAFFTVLDGYTIADLAQNRGELRALLDIGEDAHPVFAPAS